MANKGKGKSIVIGDSRTLNISQGGIARKAPDNKTNKSGGAGGQAQLSSRARLPDSSIADGPAPTCERFGAQTDGPPIPRGVGLHTKEKKGTQGQSKHNTHGRLVKVGLLLINCSPNMLARRAFYTIGQQKNPGHPLEQNVRIKRPERRRNKHRLFTL
jgi:hypothetical protein